MGRLAATRTCASSPMPGIRLVDDDSLRNPLWVAFRLMRVASPTPVERLSSFTVDERTSALVAPDAYANTGFVCALMAPQDAIGHSYGPAAQRETLLMSTVSPSGPRCTGSPGSHWRTWPAPTPTRSGRSG